MAVAIPEKNETTRDKLESAINMTPTEVREYLSSDEFAEHGSGRVKTNAERLLKILNAKGDKTATAEDTALMRQALSAIDRAKGGYGGGNPDESARDEATARAYGFDSSKKSDTKDEDDDEAPAKSDAEDDENDDEESDEDDDEEG